MKNRDTENKVKKDKTLKEITIKTTSQCGMCKERIEEEMAFEKGVKFVELDVKTKLLTIKYKENKTTVEKLKNAVAAIGYDADEIPANPEAYSKLPKCCQKGGHDHH